MLTGTNYNIEMQRAMAALPVGTPLLLHACCAPCLSTVLGRLGAHFALTVYYDNPNIAPRAEWERRLEAVRALLEQMPMERAARLVVVEYNPDVFRQAAAGLEAYPEGGARCDACFALRLNAAAHMAKQLGISWLATTLTVGPRKNAAQVNRAGEAAAQAQALQFLPADFKKQDGYRKSIELSRQYGLYRQDYCGCPYSLR